MSDTQPKSSVDLGVYGSLGLDEGMDRTDRLAVFGSLVWLGVCLLFALFIGLGDGADLGPLRFLMGFLAVTVPVALLWIAAISLKTARVMRAESERLQGALDAMRQVYVSQAQMAATTMGPNVERKIDDLVKRQAQSESRLASLSAPAPTARVISQPPVTSGDVALPSAGQQALGLGMPPVEDEVSIEDFILAMNFPETTEDKAGFIALKRALADRRASLLIRASQDVLTLLSQDGIYMDDLAPDRAHPDIWRKFAGGERGLAISSLGGVRDRSSLSLSAARMRQDQIFRDSAHHFLRTFDKTFAAMADHLTDAEIIKVAETRSARAFMLLGRVNGMFG